MIISFSKKFIFIHNPKAAGSSIANLLRQYQPFFINLLKSNYKLHNFTLVNLIKNLPEKFKNDFIKTIQLRTHSTSFDINNSLSEKSFNNFFKFGFVRNPWDLQVSFYHYILNNSGHFANKNIKKMKGFDEYIEWLCFNSLKQEEKYPLLYLNTKNKDKKIEKSFMEYIHRNYLQKEFFINEKNEIIVDFIGKFENLNNDFLYITEQIGLKNLKLPHINKTKHKNYREYYNNHTRKLIEEKFKEDIELFNYEF